MVIAFKNQEHMKQNIWHQNSKKHLLPIDKLYTQVWSINFHNYLDLIVHNSLSQNETFESYGKQFKLSMSDQVVLKEYFDQNDGKFIEETVQNMIGEFDHILRYPILRGYIWTIWITLPK